MKIFIILIIFISFSTISVFAELPTKNRSKDIPPTLTITTEGGKWYESEPAPFISNDQPQTKFYPDKKRKKDEDDLSDVQIYIK